MKDEIREKFKEILDGVGILTPAVYTEPIKNRGDVAEALLAVLELPRYAVGDEKWVKRDPSYPPGEVCKGRIIGIHIVAHRARPYYEIQPEYGRTVERVEEEIYPSREAAKKAMKEKEKGK